MTFESLHFPYIPLPISSLVLKNLLQNVSHILFFISYLLLSLDLTAMLPIMMSLTSMHFLHCSDHIILDLATAFVTWIIFCSLKYFYRLLHRLDFLLSSMISGHVFLPYFLPNSLAYGSIQYLSFFYSLISLLISSCLMALNIIFMLTTFITLVWTAPLNTNILCANWTSLSGV